MYLPQSPPKSSLHLHVQPHPDSGEPSVCMHVELDDGHVFQMFFTPDGFAGLLEDMHEAMTELHCILADYVIVDCPSVQGNHLMAIDAFATGKRRALCGVHPPKGQAWEAVPLIGPPQESDAVCPVCMQRWTPDDQPEHTRRKMP